RSDSHKSAGARLSITCRPAPYHRLPQPKRLDRSSDDGRPRQRIPALGIRALPMKRHLTPCALVAICLLPCTSARAAESQSVASLVAPSHGSAFAFGRSGYLVTTRAAV